MLRLFLASLAMGVASAANLGNWLENTSEFELPNGLKVVVLARPSSTTVSLSLLSRAGWADDPVGRRGLSRVMERIVEEGGFGMGSKNAAEEKKAFARAEELADKWEAEAAKPNADQIDVARLRVDGEGASGYWSTLHESRTFRNAVEKAGGTWNRSRAEPAVTLMSATMPANQAEVWFAGMGGWLKDPAWRNFYLHRRDAAQFSVTLDEQVIALTQLTAKAFPKHSLALPDVYPEDISKLRIRDMASFHRSAYAPGNLILAVVGDTTPAAVRALAEKHFGTLAAQPALARNWTGRDQQATFEAPAARPGLQVLTVGYRRPTVDSPDDAVLDVIAHLLFMGPDSIMQTRLVRNLKALNVTGSVSFPTTSNGLLSILAIPVPGQTFPQLEQAIQAEIDAFAQRMLTPDELLAGKRRFMAATARLLEEDDAAAELLARTWAAYGHAKDINRLFDDLEAVTPQRVQAAAQKYLKADLRVSATWQGARP